VCINVRFLDYAYLLFPKAFEYFNGTMNWISWIGHVYRMDSERKVSEICNNSPGASLLKGRPKNRRWNCVQTGVVNKCKITNWKERSKKLS